MFLRLRSAWRAELHGDWSGFLILYLVAWLIVLHCSLRGHTRGGDAALRWSVPMTKME